MLFMDSTFSFAYKILLKMTDKKQIML